MLSKSSKPYTRPQFDVLARRLREPRRFIQVVAGPRQVGKTTLVRQVLDDHPSPSLYRSADEPATRGPVWIEQQWEAARAAAHAGVAFLVLDEVQKVAGWADAVKRLWDEDSAAGRPLHVVLLGSSPLLVERGLSESLAGRFEVIRLSHWSYPEMKAAFGWDLDRFTFYGGYPGAAPLVDDPERWAHYIQDSLVETSVSRDILLLTRVDKPALLRQLFRLGCEYSGRILSYQKMLGQLQDAGNTTTLAHYLELLSGAGMITGLQKYSGSTVRRRGSSPKLLALNSALISSTLGLTYDAARADGTIWGALVESVVGAHLVNARTPGTEVTYWRARDREVDYVFSVGSQRAAIEVSSGRRKDSLPGMTEFERAHGTVRKLLVGGQGIPIETFLKRSPESWLE